MTKVMVVEDYAALREIYSIRITAEGYDVVSAGDGEEALAMAVQEKPDLILSDVMMPKISGFDMLDILRNTPETAQIKVIMMTALSSNDQRARGEQLGADRYLVKSQVGIEDVINIIHEILADRPGVPQPANTPDTMIIAQPQISPDASEQPTASGNIPVLVATSMPPAPAQPAMPPAPAQPAMPPAPQQPLTAPNPQVSNGQ